MSNDKYADLLKHEDQVMEHIDDLKLEYVDSDWESEFDDYHEAYEEQGRGQAESQAVQELIKEHNPGISDADLVRAMDFLANEWGISFN